MVAKDRQKVRSSVTRDVAAELTGMRTERFVYYLVI